MAIVGSLILRLGADARPLQAGLAAGESAVSRFASGGGLAAIGGSIALAQSAIGGLIAGVRAGAGSLVDAVSSASDFNETISKTNTIFGPAASTITATADAMSGAFGVNKTDFINAATSFGAVFKGVGKSQGDAAKMGVSLAQLGMDMASFDNAANSEVFTALQASLRGEFDPLERFRVFLTADAVAAKALSMGLAGSKSAIDENAKKMATLALISEQTKDAQGDLARTADQPANSFRRLTGTLGNLSLSFGQALLPAVGRATGLLTDLASSSLASFEASKATIQGWADSVMIAFETTVLPGLSGIAARFMELGPLATDAFGGLGSTIMSTFMTALDTVGFAWRNLPTLFEIAAIQITEKVLNLGAYFQAFGTNLGMLGEWFANNWTNLIIDGVNAVGSVFANLGSNIANLWAGIQGFLAGEGFTFEWTPLLQGFEATMAALPTMAEPAFVSLQDQIDTKLAEIAASEEARAAAMVATGKSPVAAAAAKGPAEAGAAGALAGAATYHAVAAAELGSTEAASAITRFRNEGVGRTDNTPAATAKNTARSVDIQGRMANTLEQILAKTGQPLSAFTF